MHKYIQEKITNRIHQFGIRAAIAQIFLFLIRVLYQTDRDIVFVIPKFIGHYFHSSNIKPITVESIQKFGKSGELNAEDVQLQLQFLAERCRGVYVEICGKLGGYSWLQFNGIYRFGRTGQMIIPPKHIVIKNVFVFPEFRGNKIGQQLIAASLNLIPSGVVPVILTIPENRFSIRNCEKFGFQRVLQIEKWCWFCGHWQMKLYRLGCDQNAHELEKSFV
jgi:GNAT superfamily N-acetyltransferase